MKPSILKFVAPGVIAGLLAFGVASNAVASGNAVIAGNFSSIPPSTELKCTGGTKKTCTSKLAFPCLSGWSACPLTDGNKTCCKQNSTKKPGRFMLQWLK